MLHKLNISKSAVKLTEPSEPTEKQEDISSDESSKLSNWVPPDIADGKPSTDYLPEVKYNFFRFTVPEEIKKALPDRFNRSKSTEPQTLTQRSLSSLLQRLGLHPVGPNPSLKQLERLQAALKTHSHVQIQQMCTNSLPARFKTSDDLSAVLSEVERRINEMLPKLKN